MYFEDHLTYGDIIAGLDRETHPKATHLSYDAYRDRKPPKADDLAWRDDPTFTWPDDRAAADDAS